MNVENNSRTITPEHHVKPAKTNYQKAGPAIRTQNLAKSAKPPSPVQSGRRLRSSSTRVKENGRSRTCRHFGISRKTFYKWKRRYETQGPTGLCDRPRRPFRSPAAFSSDVVSKVLYLRQNYHFGPGRIADYLRRFHGVIVALSSVHRILVRHGINRLPANQKHRAHTKRWQRYEKRQPGHRLQMDVKFLERIPGTRKRLYRFTAIDDCTRIRVLKVYDACNQNTAITSRSSGGSLGPAPN
jgi:transposase